MATRSESEKRRRCILAKCPELDSGNPKCAVCTGPVAIRDGASWTCGRARSCHGCPMDGLGLAVCWACCPGPNAGFSTDGQSIVSADKAESKDELIAHEAERQWMAERNERRGMDVNEQPSGELDAALNAVRRVLRFPSTEWEPLRIMILSEDVRSLRLAADRIGIARNLLANPGSATRRIIGRLAEVSGGDWDVLRMRIDRASVTESGAMLGVTKQAVSKREVAIRVRYDWYDRFVESLQNADRPFFVKRGVITPRKATDLRTNPHGYEHRARAGARDMSSLSHPDSGCQDK